MKATEEQKIKMRQYYYAHRKQEIRLAAKWNKEHKTRCNKNKRKYHRKLRIDALTYYGNGMCACISCGETRFPRLSIDHINNNGAEYRRKLGYGTGWRLYQWLKSNNYPEGYQTLCMNCQFIKMFEFKELKRRRGENG